MASVGDRIDTYTLLHLQARGGLFDSYEASHKKFIEVPHPHLDALEEIWQHLRERVPARLALDHARIPKLERVIELGGGSFARVYPYIEGFGWSDIRRAARCVPPPIAARVVERVARAIADVDLPEREVSFLTPSSIRIDRDGFAWLIVDMDVSIPPDPTRAGVLKGKFSFMSPEAVRGMALSPASSAFTLGSILYALIEGQSPFRSDSDLETLERIARASYTPMQRSTAEIQRVVARALTRSIGDRLESPLALADALDAVLGGSVFEGDIAAWLTEVGLLISDDEDTSPVPPASEEEILLRGIAREPTSAPPYLVYADWLQSRGHPRGDLIVLQHRAATTPDPDEKKALYREHMKILSEHREPLLGGLEVSQKLFAETIGAFEMGPHFVGDPHFGPVALRWSMGFIQSARIALDRDSEGYFPRGMKVLASHDSARFLQELTIGHFLEARELPIDEIYRALSHPFDLRSLYIGDLGLALPSAIHRGVLPISKFRGLERLALRGRELQMPHVELSSLLELRLHVALVDRSTIDGLGRCRFPSLERFELYTSRGPPLSFEPLFESEALSGVEHLVLSDPRTEHLDAILGQLAKSSLAPRLRTLGFGGRLDPAQLDRHRERFSEDCTVVSVGHVERSDPGRARRLSAR